MGYGLESSNSRSMEQVPEVSENVSVSDNNLEVSEASENYDDCGAEETGEIAEENAENYDDCIISESTEERKIENENSEEQDEFDDCILEKECDIADFEENTIEEVELNVADVSGEAQREHIFEDWISTHNNDEAESKLEYVEENTGIASEENGRLPELKEISDKRDIHAEELEKCKQEQEILAKETSDKFDAVMHEERGTDTYKKALHEYNEAKDRQAEVTSRMVDMEKEQQDLDKKVRELRTAQLEKGEMAVADSVNTLAVSDELQDRFGEHYYKKEHNINELKNIQNENSRTIEELLSEKRSVQLAMEAKMSEIHDYVFANNLKRFDTEKDSYYQKMIAEYRVLDETYHQLRYHVVKLDDNNLQISEIIGTNYESICYQQELQMEEVKSRVGEIEKFSTKHEVLTQPTELRYTSTPTIEMVEASEYDLYQDFYKKLDIIDLSQDYKEVLVEKFQIMDIELKNEYNKYASRLTCLNSSYREFDKKGVPQDAAYFSSVEGGFKFSQEDDLHNPLGAGNTFFHESGHMLDWLKGQETGRGNASCESYMTEAVYEDYYDALDRIQRDNNCDMSTAQDILSMELMSDPVASNCVSDVFGGVSFNKVFGGWGHSTEYWQNSGRDTIGKEAFAEITADRACQSVCNMAFTQKYLPKTLKAYEKALKSGGMRI